MSINISLPISVASDSGDDIPGRLGESDLVVARLFARSHGVAWGRDLSTALSSGKIPFVNVGNQICLDLAGREAFYLTFATRPGFKLCAWCPHGALDSMGWPVGPVVPDGLSVIPAGSVSVRVVRRP